MDNNCCEKCKYFGSDSVTEADIFWFQCDHPKVKPPNETGKMFSLDYDEDLECNKPPNWCPIKPKGSNQELVKL